MIVPLRAQSFFKDSVELTLASLFLDISCLCTFISQTGRTPLSHRRPYLTSTLPHGHSTKLGIPRPFRKNRGSLHTGVGCARTASASANFQNNSISPGHNYRFVYATQGRSTEIRLFEILQSCHHRHCTHEMVYRKRK